MKLKIMELNFTAFCTGFVNIIKSFFITFKAFYGGMGYDPSAKNPRFRPIISRDMEKFN